MRVILILLLMATTIKAPGLSILQNTLSKAPTPSAPVSAPTPTTPTPTTPTASTSAREGSYNYYTSQGMNRNDALNAVRNYNQPATGAPRISFTVPTTPDRTVNLA